MKTLLVLFALTHAGGWDEIDTFGPLDSEESCLAHLMEEEAVIELLEGLGDVMINPLTGEEAKYGKDIRMSCEVNGSPA